MLLSPWCCFLCRRRSLQPIRARCRHRTRGRPPPPPRPPQQQGWGDGLFWIFWTLKRRMAMASSSGMLSGW